MLYWRSHWGEIKRSRSHLNSAGDQLNLTGDNWVTCFLPMGAGFIQYTFSQQFLVCMSQEISKNSEFYQQHLRISCVQMWCFDVLDKYFLDVRTGFPIFHCCNVSEVRYRYYIIAQYFDQFLATMGPYLVLWTMIHESIR